jgi:hypothetical protein
MSVRLPGHKHSHGSLLLPRLVISSCHGNWHLALSEGVDYDAAPVSFPQCGSAYALRGIELRCQWWILAQLQFEGLETQIERSNEALRNLVNIKSQDGHSEADGVSLGEILDWEVRNHCTWMRTCSQRALPMFGRSSHTHVDRTTSVYVWLKMCPG